MKVAYLTGIYPRVTHSFIRREILAVEAAGLQVERYAIRAPTETLVDPGDQDEQRRTRYILGVGIHGLLLAMMSRFLRSPSTFLRTLAFTVRTGLRSDRGLIKQLASFAEACVLKGWLDKDGAQHLHAHFGTNAADVAMFCRRLGGPGYSFTVHGPEEFDRIETISITEKVAYASFVVAITTFAKSQLYRWCSFDDYGKIHVVRCGVDALFLAGEPRPLADRPRFVCVGRLCTHKAQLLIVDAAKELVDEGHDLEVVLVGDGDVRQPLEERIRELGLEAHVEITGWVGGAEVQARLLEARAMVLPSFAEGLPVVIMEALGLGRPVITTYVAGIPELVVDGECGWVLTPGDTVQLRDAMREVLTAPREDLERMGRVGASRVAQMHDATREGQKIAGLFERYGA
ncbi:MAG: glycosyltransferase family 4 protein [Myxococcota bacterium]